MSELFYVSMFCIRRISTDFLIPKSLKKMGFGHFKNVQNGPLRKENGRENCENQFLLENGFIYKLHKKYL
jgi:hypothetical protein